MLRWIGESLEALVPKRPSTDAPAALFKRLLPIPAGELQRHTALNNLIQTPYGHPSPSNFASRIPNPCKFSSSAPNRSQWRCAIFVETSEELASPTASSSIGLLIVKICAGKHSPTAHHPNVSPTQSKLFLSFFGPWLGHGRDHGHVRLWPGP